MSRLRRFRLAPLLVLLTALGLPAQEEPPGEDRWRPLWLVSGALLLVSAAVAALVLARGRRA